MEYIEKYQELAAGIVEQTAKDLTRAYKMLNKINRTAPTYKKDRKELNAEKMVRDCESFLRSSWFTELCNLDGELIIQACVEKAKRSSSSKKRKNHN